jgi:hypothetical protein
MSTFLGVTDEVDIFHHTDGPGKYKEHHYYIFV